MPDTKHILDSQLVLHSLSRISAITWIALSLLLPTVSGNASTHGSRDDAIGSARFLLYKYQGHVGQEDSEINREGNRVAFKSNFRLSYLGSEVLLNATMLAEPDLTPIRFEVKGDTSTQSRVDTSVEIDQRSVTIREGQSSRQVKTPDRFFTAVGFAPIRIQELLLRYWAAHGKGKLQLLPCCEAEIEFRGKDRIEVGGKRVELDRYSIDGLIWGRETVWLDAAQRLIAVITVDAEFDRFEAVREGYESALPLFVAKAAQDTIDVLARTSKQVNPLHHGHFAISGATLIDGSGRDPIPDAIVVVRDGRIAAAGPRSQVKIPKGLPAFDARGQTILPGLWDMHAHYVQVEWGPAYLAAGITTARDCGNDFNFIVPVRDAIRAKRILGPRLLLAGYVDGDGKEGLGSIRAKTPEEARMVVRRYHQASFEQIKIYGNAPLKTEVVKAITDEAHRLGMTVTGHVPRGMNAMQAVEAGYDQINHIGFLFPFFRARNVQPAPGQFPPLDMQSAEAQRTIQFLKEKGTVIEPTFARFEFNTHPIDTPFSEIESGAGKAPSVLSSIFNSTGIPSERAARAQARAEEAGVILRALHEAGIPIVAGIDLAVPGHSLHRELELYVKAGLSPMEAIQTATIVPARAMKLDKELGTVEVGKRADLIIVDGNPVESISNIRRVQHVIVNGRLLDSSLLWRSVGFQP